MLGNSPDQHQLNLLEPTLPYMVRKDDIFVLLAKAIPWKDIQNRFQKLYSSRGAPSHPIRKMVGLLLLQHMDQHSDESAVETWKHNIYWQYFCGEVLHTTQQPCAASDLVHFRKRIGKEGIDYLFSLSAQLHKTKIAKAKEVIVDTTVQESKTTFPTDAKLYKKVIERCNAIAKKSKVTLRQSYRLKTQRKKHFPQSQVPITQTHESTFYYTKPAPNLTKYKQPNRPEPMPSTTLHHPRTNFFEQVVQIVKLIPHGRVTTYGAIANCLGSKQSARMVGWALNHTHKMPEVPAHRVVNRQGTLTGKHHFEHIGSMQAQLAAEGIVVKDDQVQDMRKVFWDPAKEIIKAPTW